MKNPTFSILLPTYKSAQIVSETIDSILGQSFRDFELIIVDDNSPDNTYKVLEKYSKKDKRIRLSSNKKNLGYAGNLQKCLDLATGKYVFLMGNDDILSPIALERTLQGFQMDPDVGVVTRPFYCFEDKNIERAVRVFGKPLDPNHDRVISIFDGRKEYLSIYTSIGQLSGLAMRREWIEAPVNPHIFPAHAYPFFSIFRKHKAVHLKDYLLAVRMFSSQTRSMSSIYDPSPTWTWIKMFEDLLPREKYKNPREWGIDFISADYVGLIQIKNFGKWRQLFREIGVMIKYRPRNLINLRFWFYTVGVIVMPRFILIPLVDWFKSNIKALKLKDVKLRYK